MAKRGKSIVAYVIIGLITIFLIVALEGGCSNSCSSSVVINRYDAVITLDDAGNGKIVEKWTYNYKSDKVAKYRDIDVNKYNSQNPITQSKSDIANLKLGDITEAIKVTVGGEELTSLDIGSNRKFVDGYAYCGVTGQLDERGDVIACDPNSGSCTSLFVYVPSGLSGEVIFEYTYTIEGLLTLYDDVASVNWNLFNYNESAVKKGTVKIVLPNNDYFDDLRLWARGASEGSIDLTSANEVNIEFSSVSKNLEFRLLSNPAIYSNVNEVNKVNADVLTDILDLETKQAKLDNFRIVLARVILIVSIIIVLGMGAITYFIVYKKYDKEYKSTFDAKYLRELPDETLTPAEMSYMYYFGKINDEDVTATLLDLIRRKYLIMETYGEFVTEKNPNFEISINPSMNRNNLKAHEKYLIDWFVGEIGDGQKVTISQIEGYCKKERNAQRYVSKANGFVNICKEEGKAYDFIETNSNKKVAFSYGLIPLVGLVITVLLASKYNLSVFYPMLLLFLCTIAYYIYVSTIKRRTVKGNEQYVRWNAFKNFLEDFGNMKDYPMPGLIIWEHFLVYATSFKIADKVMQQLKVKLPNVPEDVEQSTFMRYSYSSNGFYYAHSLSRLSRSVSQARNQSMQTIARATASKVSSSGKGGGFSGGSSFGGGGGGGRSR